MEVGEISTHEKKMCDNLCHEMTQDLSKTLNGIGLRKLLNIRLFMCLKISAPESKYLRNGRRFSTWNKRGEKGRWILLRSRRKKKYDWESIQLLMCKTSFIQKNN